MSRRTLLEVQIRFGDCDPAGIVFFPRYHRWMDAASLHFFMTCGVPPWHELERINGIIGTPMLEHRTRFLRSATYGETIEIRTEAIEWGPKAFVQRHTIFRGEDLICESHETRVFCVRELHDPKRIRAIPIPEDIRKLCD